MSNINQFYSQEQEQQQDLPWPLGTMQFDPQQLQQQQQQQQITTTTTTSSAFIQPISFISNQQHHSGGGGGFSSSISPQLNMNVPNIIPLNMLPSNQQSILTPEQQQQFLHQQQQQQQQQHHPPLDANGQPIKIRKKPGRKPNPASPALRKAQNRAAQRAFRERKERHLRDLENTIRSLRDQRNSTAKELATVKSKLDGCKAENWYLRGVVLTLQFVCLHHHIHIPTHSPYLTEEALADIAKTSPHAIEAYVNAYTQNNVDLKPTMATQFAHVSKNEEEEEEEEEENEDSYSVQQQQYQQEEEQQQHYNEEEEDDMMSEVKTELSMMPDLISIPQQLGEPIGATTTNTIDPSMLHHSHTLSSLSPSLTDVDDIMSKTTENDHDIKLEGEQEETGHEMNRNHHPLEENQEPSISSLGAIQKIRLQLRVQSALSNLGKSTTRLQPTLLQLAISHDPRIDLIPTPHMRDRMIIFRDLMDYDRCFSLLLNGAVYHGGDPTMSDSWELPAEFFSEFWFLAINYDLSKTNKWRSLKGLPELEMGPKEGQQQQLYQQINENLNPTLWGDELLDQFTEPMPTLQPLSLSKPPKSVPPQSPSSSHSTHSQISNNHDSPSHPMYENLRSPPELRDPVHAPSLDTMMNLMHNLSTDP
ncbi:hypothetical protein INT45_001626 [Circinella minor]|uniref:BZIP domain-containing protein n=1 Tax=Circinella minor TaxID=1195481 RepID=A0A8H7RZ87_9FUNG|nr:hypothetical protein INT45_001626 [Circinella minor]